ncbi:hypothetical protein SAMN05421739_10253 [Pontibacter chinhatensis]|uniref:Uncharacterized protein n=1 Tax=Pontibacter chinhatensis TaxID=1436961 RepID=A0A1I2QMC1_9BACT|nr:hypothetical protein SAMN05421739_10253 [Pontibacter chinhatensis]
MAAGFKLPAVFIPNIPTELIMETNAFKQASLEQLHRLYYNLQHRILREIFLSDQV